MSRPDRGAYTYISSGSKGIQTTMRRLPLLLAAVLALPVVACGSAAEDGDIGTSEHDVEGGNLDTSSANNFAVGITMGANAVCSGTLIAPNLVLTARHCVVADDGNEWVTCKTKFGPPVAPETLKVTTSPNLYRADRFYPAKKIVVPQEDGFCGNDLALVLLDKNIPESEAIPAIPVVQFDMTESAQIGKQITALGYGLTNPSAKDSGVRRIRQNIGIVCVPGSDKLACTGEAQKLADSQSEFITEGYVCSGDSGGGAFEQRSFLSGKPFVLGTLSRGPQTNDRCLAAIYTRTDMHSDLIVSAALEAAQLGGYDTPSWTTAPVHPRVGETQCKGNVCTSVEATEPAPAPSSNATDHGGCSIGTTRSSSRGDFLVLGLAALGLAVARRRARA